MEDYLEELLHARELEETWLLEETAVMENGEDAERCLTLSALKPQEYYSDAFEL